MMPVDKPENVMAPLEVIPVAVVIAPVELTWNWDEEPTDKSEAGLVAPMPIFPSDCIVIFTFEEDGSPKPIPNLLAPNVQAELDATRNTLAPCGACII
jgi:hypothetical protein